MTAATVAVMPLTTRDIYGSESFGPATFGLGLAAMIAVGWASGNKRRRRRKPRRKKKTT